MIAAVSGLRAPPSPAVTVPRYVWVALAEPYEAGSLAQGLVNAGWIVEHVFNDLASVVSALATTTVMPDVIVSALRFEDGDGLRLIRMLGREPEPPALFVISHQQRAVIKSALALAEACAVRIAGSAEWPVDVASIVTTLAAFSVRPPSEAPAIPPRLLERGELLQLLDRGCVQARLEPQLRLSSGEIIGVEALMRAQDEAGTPISLDRFMPALAAHGLLAEATLLVFDQAVDFAAQALARGMALRACVDVSMHSLSDHLFCRKLLRTVERAGLDPSWITLELTGTDGKAEPATVIENTARMRMLGFNLSFDDFGSAYCSLSHLSRLPFSELKIERTFVSGVDLDPGKAAIVQACSRLGAALGLHVVAEGVETLQELETIRRVECSIVQGSLVSAPRPKDDALHWLGELVDMRLDLPT